MVNVQTLTTSHMITYTSTSYSKQRQVMVVAVFSTIFWIACHAVEKLHGRKQPAANTVY